MKTFHPLLVAPRRFARHKIRITQLAIMIAAIIAVLQTAGSQGPATTCIAPPSGMVAWYPGDGDFTDIQGPTFENGTQQGGATFVLGQVGQAFSFNGTTGYVSLGNPASLKISGALTIDAWINPSAMPASGALGAIMTKWTQDVSLSSTSDSYGLWVVNRGGTLKLFSALHKTTGVEPNIEGGIIPLNTWSHVAMTFDPTSGNYLLYINGVQVASQTSTGNNLATDRNVSIGREESFLPRYFTGLIDEVEIFNRALPQSEVLSIVNAGSFGKCKPGFVPANNNFANAEILSAAIGTTNGTNFGANKETSEPNHAGNAGGASVWYRWQAPGSGSAFFNTLGSDFDTVLGIYTGSSVNALSLIGSNDNFIMNDLGFIQSEVRFNAVGGTTYYIAVDGKDGAIGNITLNWGLSSTACTPPPANLVSWYPGDGDFTDIQGPTFENGTSQGATFAAGQVGQAFSLNGTTGHVSLGNPAALKLSSAITIDAWIKPATAPASGQLAAIVTKWAQNFQGTAQSDSYGLWIVNRSGTLRLAGGILQTGAEPVIEGGTIPLNTWSHVAMTFDSTSGRLAIYVNGQEVASFVSPGNIIATDKNVLIGREDSFLPRPFSGFIDEVEIFNRALPQSDLQSIVNAGSFGKCKPGFVPANNNFANAEILSAAVGTSNGTNFGANKETSEPNHAGNAGGASVWYRWQAPSSGSAFFNTLGSDFDTLLGVYTGSSVNALTLIGSNDNVIIDDIGYIQSQVRFEAVSGTTYFIAVDGKNGAIGNITLHWGLSTTTGPANNNFANAQIISGATGTVNNGSNVGANKETGEPNHAGNTGGASVWYRWQPPSGGNAFVNTLGSDFDTILGVYTGSSVNALTLIASNNNFIENDIGFIQSQVRFIATAGAVYYIAVDGAGGATGNITLNWGVSSGGCPTVSGVSPTSGNVGSPVTISGTNFAGVTAVKFTNNVAATNVNIVNDTTITADVPTGATTGPIAISKAGCTGVQTATSFTVGTSGGCATVPAPTNWYPGQGDANDTRSAANGTVTGNVTYPDGKVGKAFGFDGETYVTLPTLNLGQNFSVEFWLNPARGGRYQHLVSNTFSVREFGSFYYNEGKLSYWPLGASLDSTAVIPLNQWTHTALVYDGSVVSLYVNGVLDRPSTPRDINFNNPVRLGNGINPDSALTFQGMLDEVSFYNAALTAAQVQDIFNAGDAGKCPASPTPTCAFTLASTTASLAASGGTGSVSFTATASSCAWIASSNASFLTFTPTSATSGTGNGTVSFSATANPSSSPRSGTLTIAEQTFTVTQDGTTPGGTGTLAQQAYLKASNPGADDEFGYSVAVSGDTMVVGSRDESSNATGVNGDQSNNNAVDAGAAYVFVRNAGVWTQQAYLKASNTGAGDGFGSAVAISGDMLVVGAPGEDSNATVVNGDQTNNSAVQSGAVYVFVRNAGVWTQQAYLKASNTGAGDGFGSSVAISGDSVVVGAINEHSNATGVNGEQINNNALFSGAAYVFVRSGATWSQQAYLKASNTGAEDSFGSSVAISGETVVVGALLEDSNATGVNGNQTNNSSLNSGAAYVFVRNGTTWSQQAYLKASNTRPDVRFGSSVAMSGDTVVVGAPFEQSVCCDGAAYVFVRSGTTWSQQAYLKASNTGSSDSFGYSVAVSGETVLVGANGEDSEATGVNGDQSDNSASNSGAAYVFVRNGTTWSQQAYLKASNTGAGDFFGSSVAISGDTMGIGARNEQSNAIDLNGCGAVGAAYVFTTPTTSQPSCPIVFGVNPSSGTVGASVTITGTNLTGVTSVKFANNVTATFTVVSSTTITASVPDCAVTGPITLSKASCPEAQTATFNVSTYLKASNTGATDHFGTSVAVSGDTMVVGADDEDSNATGVNGDQTNNSASGSGAAYVFVRGTCGWIQQAYLKASNTGTGDEFGYSVAISGDTMVVGAPLEASNATGVNGDQTNNSAVLSGAVYVFVRNAGVWTQQAYLKASNSGAGDFFGHTVAISGDTVVVGASLEDSNASGVNGDQTNNNAAESGAAYVFVRNGTTWSQQAYLKASNTGANDRFSSAVAISGDSVVVGADDEDSNATGVNGDQTSNSAADSGAAYLFVRSGTTWSQQAYLKASNTGASDSFGQSVAISSETVVVGAWLEASNATGVNGDQTNNSVRNAGAAYVFTRSAGVWTQQAYLKPSNLGEDDFFGNAVAISGETLVVGADNQSDCLDNSGAAFVFSRSGTTWSQQVYIKASNKELDDNFGNAVSISGDTLVVGADTESSNATGVNGDQTNNSAASSGAAYVFTSLGPSNTKANQTITFNALADKSFGDAPFTISATATSGLLVSFSIVSGPASVSGNTISITGVGVVTVRASQAGDTNFNAATSVDQTFTVAKANQTITFNALADKSFGDAPFTISATATSGLPVSFSIVSGPASVSGNTISITGVGVVTVRASQAGDTNFNAATSVDRTFTVGTSGGCAVKADYQFQDTRARAGGEPPDLADLGNNTFATATVDGSSRRVLQFAQQAGLALAPTTGVIDNGVYSVVMLFAFDEISSYRRILDFKNNKVDIDSGLYNDNGNLIFYGTSSFNGGTGKPIAANAFVQVVLTRDANKNVTGYVNGAQQFTFGDSGDLALIDDNNRLIFFRDNSNPLEASAGKVARIRLYDCALTAPEVAALGLLPTGGKANQTITFNALADKSFGDAPFTISATATSGLPVSFSIVSGPASVSGNTISITGVGVVTVRASQAGDTNFNAATSVDRTFTVAKANQTITFNALADKSFGDAPFTVSATATSGLPVSFSIVLGPAAISGNTISITGVGVVTVRASQAGDTNFNAATSVDRTFTVGTTSTAIYRINSGGPDVAPFSADNFVVGGATGSTTASINTSGVINPAPSAVYQTERFSNFTYTFPGLTPGATYTARLHFAEIFLTGPGQRVFNVAINGNPVLSSYDIFADAGGANKAVVKEFVTTANSSGQIVIVYTPFIDNPKSSGVEIIAGGGPTCAFTLASTTASLAGNGGVGSVSFTATASSCAWTATSNASFLTFTSATSGTGSGTVSFTATVNPSSSPRTGTLTIAGQTFTVNQVAGGCAFTLSPTNAPVSAGGGAGSVGFTATANDCAWTASSNASFLTIVSVSSGGGNGTVNYSVAANPSSNARTGTLSIGGQTFTVNQAGVSCGFTLLSTSASSTATGGPASVSFTATAGDCPWTASSNAGFLTITSATSGTGSGTVSYTAAANPTTSPRTGTLTIAGQTFTVNQVAAGCAFTLSSTNSSVSAGGGTGSVGFTSNGFSCAWTASSNINWLTITSVSSGGGNGTINYSAAANTSSNARAGTLSVGGQTFTVTQPGVSCAFTLLSTSASVTANGGPASVSFTATANDCAWSASSNASFLTITSATSGTGSSTVSYTAAANPSSNPRSGTITIAGQTFTVNQAGSTFEPVVLTTDQVTLKHWLFQGRNYAYVKLSFPDAGYRVVNWGQPVRSGNDFSADAAVERFIGPSVQAITTTAQIYDLGPLSSGNYTFAFKNSGTVVKSVAFTVSSAAPPPNPIDTAREFVRQQYRDFLNREADQAGEEFWTDNITQCNDPARRPPGQTVEQCTLRQRETTSGAFFLSPEFQYTGYYVLRMYQGALGRQPKLSEFTPDALFVGAGILVNSQLSGARINQNKADFAQQFVNCLDPSRYRCREFKAIYDGLSNQQYVDKLFETTGVNASASDRAALVNGLNSGTETRASVLQKVVDGINVISEGNQQFTTSYGQAFYNSESNRAFVQLEYFGYMKRDPDDAGYAFWLGKLNQFGGNFVNAEMVLAFISSPEYRAQFGQP